MTKQKELILSYAEFSRCLGVSRQFTGMNVKRGNILADEEKKTVDAELAENKIWLDSQIASGKTWDLNRKNVKTQSKDNQSVSQGAPRGGDKFKLTPYQKKLQKIDFDKKLIELTRSQNAAKLEEMRIKKMEGELIPYDAVKSVFIYSVETARSTFLQNTNAMANIFVERLGADNEQFKELQKEIMQNVNETMVDFKKSLIDGVDDIVHEKQ